MKHGLSGHTVGVMSVEPQIRPFNEYMLNSFLAMIFEKDGDNAYWFYNDAFGFNGEPDGRFFTQNNGNVVRKPAQLDYQTENGIKYRIGSNSWKLPLAGTEKS